MKLVKVDIINQSDSIDQNNDKRSVIPSVFDFIYFFQGFFICDDEIFQLKIRVLKGFFYKGFDIREAGFSEHLVGFYQSSIDKFGFISLLRA